MAVTEVKTYQAFRGVDYSASPAVISDVHAQDMRNMYIGADGVMQKRPGWHILKTFEANEDRLPINGIHYLPIGKGNGVIFIHAGTRMYWTRIAKGLRHFDTESGDVPFFRTADDKPTQDDVNAVTYYITGALTAAEWQVRNMDADGDGVVTAKDRAIWDDDFTDCTNGVMASSYKQVTTPGDLNNGKSVSFVHSGKLYFLDGDEYYVIKKTSSGYAAELVDGYIPTTGVNGHYEYLEPQSETTEGDTIVEKATDTLTSGETTAGFSAVKPFASRIVVSMTVNDMSVCNAHLVETSNNTVNIGTFHLEYSSGTVTVSSTSTPLQQGDKVTLFVKEEDSEQITAGEPGTQSNPGTWVRPEADEDRNMIQPKQINTFAADGIHKAYYLTDNACIVYKVEVYRWTRCKSVNGVDTPTQDEIDVIDAGRSPVTGIYYYYTYVWTECRENDGTASDDPTYGWTARNASSNTPDQNAISYTTRIRFNSAIDAASGRPNIRVTFAPMKYASDWASARNRSYISQCSIVTRFGYFNDNRFIFAGNPAHKNMDWMSSIDDPTYFPNAGWTMIGSGQTAIQGYLKYGTELAIIKEDNGQDATIYMRSAIQTEDNNIIFPVQQGAQGVGALSKWCMKTLKDEPLFLAREGVYAIQGTDASQERTIPNRSFYVDRELRKEASSMCVAAVFRDYYIVCNPTTGKCFVADARYQGLPPGTNDRQHGYEWYVWDNIPASVFLATDDSLYFGTQDGRLCAFNFDWDNPMCYTDGAEFRDGATVLHRWHPYDGGYPINAYYVTRRDHLEVIDYKKTMLNDGGVITLQPHEMSSASVTVKTEKGEWFVDQIQTDGDEPSVVIPIRHRFKNFDSIETHIENNKIKEGLSILGLQYRYHLGTNRR